MTYNKTFVTSLTGTGNVADANAYKDEIAKDLGVGRDIPTRIGANLGFGTNAQIYRELASAVDSIEQAQDQGSYANIARGMKTPSLDVAEASKELVEICRQHLKEIDTHPTLDEDEKKKQRQEVFDILETVRIANAREKTLKWTKDFYSALGKNIKDNINESIKWPNILSNLFKIGVCVAVFVVASIFLAPVSPAIMPLMFLALSAYCAWRIFQGISAAYTTANQAAMKEKKEAAQQVLAMAAEEAKNISEENKVAREAAKKEMETAQTDFAKENKAFTDNEKIIKDATELKEIIDLYTVINTATDIKDITGHTNPKVRELFTQLREPLFKADPLNQPDLAAIQKVTNATLPNLQKNFDDNHQKQFLIAVHYRPTLETAKNKAEAILTTKKDAYDTLEKHETHATTAQKRIDNADPNKMSLKERLKAGAPQKPAVASPITSPGTGTGNKFSKM